VPQPFKFVGQYGVMAETDGFYYMRARYYDPEVGRFISEDPMGFDGGDVNLYAYAGNNPVMLVDPLGLWSVSVGIVGSAAIGGGGGGGTFLNIGHDPNAGWFSDWSASITGTAMVGAVAGTDASVGVAVSLSDAKNVGDLVGASNEVGRGGIGRTGFGYFQSPDGTVQGVTGAISVKSTAQGYTAAYVGRSDTSAIVQWSQGKGISFGVSSNGTVMK